MTRRLLIDPNQPDPTLLAEAAAILQHGGLVAFPTETVYGLAASALDEAAVDRLLRVKGRRAGQPLTLAIRSAEEAKDYAPDLSPLAHRLARRCWPGPITLVLDDSHPQSLVRRLPCSVQQAVSPSDAVGLRVPGHKLILDVMQMVVGPLVLSSANRSGQPPLTRAEEVAREFGDEVALVLDTGPCPGGLPSTVVDVSRRPFRVVRSGAVALSEILAVIPDLT
ncbi:MAG: threonylcarbamoyl-AMP synthase [Chloroflexi bacterium]|nr:threonylcarbamoyl-AMP synthase [Chloroflexota bacterium]